MRRGRQRSVPMAVSVSSRSSNRHRGGRAESLITAPQRRGSCSPSCRARKAGKSKVSTEPKVQFGTIRRVVWEFRRFEGTIEPIGTGVAAEQQRKTRDKGLTKL